MSRHFKTGLRVVPGEWNRISVRKSKETLSCALNDGDRKYFPYDRRMNLFQTAIFGANVMKGDRLPADIKPFKVALRTMRVRHGIE